MKHIASITTLVLIVSILGGCSSGSMEAAKRDLELDLRPKPQPEQPQDVSTPDLDERDEDHQFLSRINALSAEVNRCQEQLASARGEREEALMTARSARENETRLAEYNEQLQQLLDDTQSRERELQDQLLRARLEIVQLKKDIQLRKIRELTESSQK